MRSSPEHPFGGRGAGRPSWEKEPLTLGATRRDVRFSGPWRDSLNASQREAVTHGDGPLLIIAGAGTGKTTTLACRVAHLIESGVPEQRILLLTFSRRAAAELLSRAQTLIDHGGVRKVWGGTFHAMANRMLRMHGRTIGIGPDFTVLDQADTADLLNLIRGSTNVKLQHERFARKETLATIYSRMVNAGEPLRRILEQHFPWCSNDRPAIAEIFTAYTRRKRQDAVLDYDDLLLFWNALMASSAGERVSEQFDHILVDEYQDTNALQAEILLRFHARIPNITVVGDDAQAIYSFRSATIDNILSFAQRFTGARIVALEDNYRSTAPLLAASNAVIALSPQRHEKTLVSTREGGQKPELITCGDEAEQAAAVCELHPRASRAGRPAHAAGGALSGRASQRSARGRAGSPQHPVRQIRRPEISRSRARQGCCGDPAHPGEPARTR